MHCKTHIGDHEFPKVDKVRVFLKQPSMIKIFFLTLTFLTTVLHISAMEARSETEEFYVEQGEQYAKKGGTEAVESYTKALEINDKSCKAYRGLVLSTKEIGQKELDSLLHRLKKKEELDSRNDCLFYGIGLVFAVNGDYEKSTSYFKSALSINPENPYAHNGLGVDFLMKKDYDGAEKEFRTALRKDPEFLLPFQNLLTLYDKTKQFDKALDAVKGFKGKALDKYRRTKLCEYYSFKKRNIGSFLAWYLKGLTYTILDHILMIAAVILLAVLYLISKKASNIGPEKIRQSGFGILVLFSVTMTLYWFIGSNMFFLLSRSSFRLTAYLFHVVFSSLGSIFLASAFIFLALERKRQTFTAMWGTAEGGIVRSSFKTILRIYLSIFIYGIIVGILSIFINIDVLSKPHPVFSEITILPDTILKSYMVFRVVFLAPFFEEVVFRGLLYSTMKELYGTKKGIYLSSMIFGLYHSQISLVFFAIIIGVFLAKSYEESKSLTTPLIIHVFINSFATLLFILFGIPRS